MKNVLKIFKRDLKNIFTNWVALIIVLAIIILPSLYAWFNIKSCWDPYGNTGGIKVAVVNEDKGGVFNKKEYNVGDELIEKLEDNDSFGWQFVSKEEADKGVLEGSYYASIEIPEDFTRDILSLTKTHIVRPSLIYNINEKSNAIVPKITNTGVNTVKDELNSNIVKVVNGVIFNVFNQVGVSAEDYKETLRNIIDDIYNLNDRMPELEQIVDEASNGIVAVDKVIEKVREIVPKASSTIDKGQALIENGQAKMDEAKAEGERKSLELKNYILEAQNKINSIEATIKADGTEALKNKLILIQGKLEETDNKLNYAISSLDMLKTKLGKLGMNVDQLDALIKEVEGLEYKVSEALKYVNGIITDIASGNISNPAVAHVINTVQGKIGEIKLKVDGIVNRYDSEIAPFLIEAYKSATDVANSGNEVLAMAENTIPDINYIINIATKDSSFAKDELQKLKDKIPSIKEKVGNLVDKIKEYDNGEDFDKLVDLLINNSEDSSNFLSNVVEVEKNSIFEVPNYGSGMSPFYTTLALWVGGTILVSLLTTHANKFKDGEDITPLQEYFGKGLTFVTIAIAQGLVVTVGDMVILKTYVVNPVLFALIGIFTAVVFVTFIYTLVSIFGNVGKALAIIFLVLQVAASGGTFPIEVMSGFFQTINPLLPFKYAIGLMRETTAGIVQSIFISNLIYLSIYFVVAIIMGVGLKKFVNKYTRKLSSKLDESGIVGH